MSSPAPSDPAGPAFWLKSGRGLLLALLLSAAGVSWRAADTQWKTWMFDRYHLPGFDSFVYVAMAEEPAVFSVAPWGYRVLYPWLVHVVGPGDVVRGFRRVGRGLCVAAGPLLFLLLRRQGHGELAALLGVAAFSLSAPMGEAVTNFLLVEPFGIVMLLLLLHALEAERVPLVAATLAAGTLGKELFLLLLPAAFFAFAARRGLKRAIAPSLVACAPALLCHLSLRLCWAAAPGQTPWSLPSVHELKAAGGRVLASWPDWWQPVVAAGLPLALIAASLPAGRALLKRHGYLLLVTLALPFAAGIYTGEAAPSAFFFSDDVTRLLLYALPLLLSLALFALERLCRQPARPPAAPTTARGRLDKLATLAAAAAVLLPFAALDGYRRADLSGSRDGPLVLAFCRESLAFARRIDLGKPVVYEPAGRRFHPARSDRRHLERMRWFLRDGWGPLPHYGMGEVSMAAETAALVVPCLAPRELQAMLQLRAGAPVELALTVNGSAVGRVLAGPAAARQRFSIPARVLFRGDNELRLSGPGAAGVDLLQFNLRAPAGSEPPKPGAD